MAKMTSDEIVRVVQALVRPIEPEGDTWMDDKRNDKRMQNVETLTKVIDELWQSLLNIECKYRDDRLASRKAIAKRIEKFTTGLIVNSWEKAEATPSMEWALTERLNSLKHFTIDDDKDLPLNTLERMAICQVMQASIGGKFNEDICDKAIQMLWPLEMEQWQKSLLKNHPRRKRITQAIALLMAALDRNYHMDEE